MDNDKTQEKGTITMSTILDENLKQEILSIYPPSASVRGMLFVFERIPPKKLKNAVKGYAPDATRDTVIALCDSTVFGSAKEGFLLTTERLYGKQIMTAGSCVNVKEITSVSYHKGKSRLDMNMVHIHTNMGTLELSLMGGAEDSEAIFTFLEKAIKILKNTKSSIAGASQQDTGYCSSCGAAGNGRFCEYCGNSL